MLADLCKCNEQLVGGEHRDYLSQYIKYFMSIWYGLVNGTVGWILSVSQGLCVKGLVPPYHVLLECGAFKK